MAKRRSLATELKQLARQRRLHIHPYAAAFPLMKREELEGLAADIREHGLREPIVICWAEVIDGRNRLLAARMAKVRLSAGHYRELPDDTSEQEVIAHIRSANIHRRHLTTGQRAMLAAKAAELLGPSVWERRREVLSGYAKLQERKGTEGRFSGPSTGTVVKTTVPGRAREKVAEEHAVHPDSVARASALRKHRPDLAAKVAAAEMTLGAAYSAHEKDAGRPAKVAANEVALEEARRKYRAGRRLTRKEFDLVRRKGETLLRRLRSFMAFARSCSPPDPRDWNLITKDEREEALALLEEAIAWVDGQEKAISTFVEELNRRSKPQHDEEEP